MTSQLAFFQSPFPASIRRQVASLLERHVQIHLLSKPARSISLVYGPIHAKASRPAHRFTIAAALPAFGTTLGKLSRYGLQKLDPLGDVLLVESPDGQNLMVEISYPEQTSPAIRVVSGPTAEALRRALTRIPKFPRGKPVELSILRIAALHLSAVRCRVPARSKPGVFIPYAANCARVKPDRAYTLTYFERSLKNLAVQTIITWYERTEQSRSLRSKDDERPARS